MKEKISLPMARRIALAAQGFADARPAATPDRRHLARVLARTGLLQIDSVSAVVRAHYMPLFSRLGPYPTPLLDEAASKKPRRLFEYWAHEASFLPVEMWPLMQWRMARAAKGEGKSHISVNLASVMALDGKRVILVDADMRRPSVHKVLDLENQRGLSNVLVGQLSLQEALQDTDLDNLQVICSGPIPPNPPELLGSRAFEDLMDRLEQLADVVIFDSPYAPNSASMLSVSTDRPGTCSRECSTGVSPEASNTTLALGLWLAAERNASSTNSGTFAPNQTNNRFGGMGSGFSGSAGTAAGLPSPSWLPTQRG